MPEYVKIEKGHGPDGRIAVVRFDRGDAINALSPEAMRQLTNAARSFEDDADTSVVVLTGSATSFTAGFDLKDPEGRARKTMDLGTLRRHLKLGPRMTPGLAGHGADHDRRHRGLLHRRRRGAGGRARLPRHGPRTAICACRRSGSA